jgi:hypothetical protein
MEPEPEPGFDSDRCRLFPFSLVGLLDSLRGLGATVEEPKSSGRT